jgi:hypothetical protein
MSALPNPQALAQKFADEVWTEEFGNVSSPALIQAWTQLFVLYNDCIQKNQSGVQPVRKQVVPMPTGTGKSQATIYYLQQLEEVEDVGVLVVSYFEEEAKLACHTVNEQTDDTANYHSANHPLKGVEINSTQVLYITHAQYLLALQEPLRMERLNAFNDKPRLLVVIDESLSQVKGYQITVNDFNTAISKIGQLLASGRNEVEQDKAALKDESEYLSSARTLLQELDGTITRYSGVYPTNEQHNILKQPIGTLSCLSTYCSDKKKRQLLKRIDQSTDVEILKKVVAALSAIQSHDVCYFSQTDDGLCLNAVSWINIAEQHTVVLDATANVSHIYTLHPDVEIVPIDKGLRRYDNVILHVSEQQYKLGRDALNSNVSDEDLMYALINLISSACPRNDEIDVEEFTALMENRKPMSAAKDRVLIVTSLKTEENLQDTYPFIGGDFYAISHVNHEIAHWGNITGKNDFKHYNKIILLGLYHRPSTHTTNLHITSERGLKAIRHHNEAELDSDIQDERIKIKNSEMAAEMIQAINRVRCRSVIDAEGNCANTDIYIFAPSEHNVFSDILETIKAQMPGINVRTNPVLVLPEQLIHNREGRTGRPTDEYDLRFMDHVRNLPAGEYSTSEIKKDAGIGDTPMKRIWSSVEEADHSFDENHSLHVFSKEQGITVQGTGRGKKMIKK